MTSKLGISLGLLVAVAALTFGGAAIGDGLAKKLPLSAFLDTQGSTYRLMPPRRRPAKPPASAPIAPRAGPHRRVRGRGWRRADII